MNIEAIPNNGVSISNANTNISLEQNQSNVTNENATIRYHIPAGSKGQINIYDQDGKIIRVLNANASGQSELNRYALTTGTYTYTLLINNKVALSRQLVIIK